MQIVRYIFLIKVLICVYNTGNNSYSAIWNEWLQKYEPE